MDLLHSKKATCKPLQCPSFRHSLGFLPSCGHNIWCTSDHCRIATMESNPMQMEETVFFFFWIAGHGSDLCASKGLRNVLNFYLTSERPIADEQTLKNTHSTCKHAHQIDSVMYVYCHKKAFTQTKVNELFRTVCVCNCNIVQLLVSMF